MSGFWLVLKHRLLYHAQLLSNVEDYEGYFPCDDAGALEGLLSRCAVDLEFYKRLKSQVEARSSLFSYAEETRLWGEMLKVAR